MKTIIYYLLLLVLIAVTGGYLMQAGDMSGSLMFAVAAILILYTIGISLVGETSTVTDEKEVLYKNLSNRAALVAGTIIFSVGLIFQMFVTHQLDWWLLVGLIVINLTKIISLIYLNFRKIV